MERLYGSLDHGITHNTSFGLWYLDPFGKMHRLMSYLNNGGTTAGHAEEIWNRISSFPFTCGQMPIKIWADPSMWTKQRLNEDTVRSNIDEYIDYFRLKGARTVFEKANNDKINGCAILRQQLADRDGMPNLYYWHGYNATFNEGLTSAQTDPNNRDIYLKLDGDDVADECRYGVLGMYSLNALDNKRKHTENLADRLNKQIETADWYNL
jgi:hypothetical protein